MENGRNRYFKEENKLTEEGEKSLFKKRYPGSLVEMWSKGIMYIER